MSKINDRLALAAQLAAVVGIVFLGVEVAQNTRAIQSQTRDSITEKEMEYYGWLANDRELAQIVVTATREGVDDLDEVERRMWTGFAVAVLREWENSQYQHERGLFSVDEYEGRFINMREMIRTPGFRWTWRNEGEKFAAPFRELIDGFLAAERGE